MELSFSELDNISNKQNEFNNNNNNTYYDALLPKSNTPQYPIYNDEDYNNIVVVKKPQYNKLQTLNKSQNPIINTNKKITSPKKKQVSYDDILSSMNMIVIDGKLEFIKKDILQNIATNQQSQQPQQKKVTFNHLLTPNTPRSQIDKGSYIYNKYFKDYKDHQQNQVEVPTRPLTKNELIKQLIINKVNIINERNRIAEIKSTKLLFNNNNNRNIIINSRNIPNANDMNHLFRYK